MELKKTKIRKDMPLSKDEKLSTSMEYVVAITTKACVADSEKAL